MNAKKSRGPHPGPPVDAKTLPTRPATALQQRVHGLVSKGRQGVALLLDRRIRAVETELAALEQLERQLLIGNR